MNEKEFLETLVASFGDVKVMEESKGPRPNFILYLLHLDRHYEILLLLSQNNYCVSVELNCIGSDEWVYGYKINYLPAEFIDEKRRSVHFQEIESYKENYGGTYDGGWDTYEEALIEGLRAACRLFLGIPK